MTINCALCGDEILVTIDMTKNSLYTGKPGRETIHGTHMGPPMCCYDIGPPVRRSERCCPKCVNQLAKLDMSVDEAWCKFFQPIWDFMYGNWTI